LIVSSIRSVARSLAAVALYAELRRHEERRLLSELKRQSAKQKVG
jgi:hypothetical protein